MFGGIRSCTPWVRPGDRRYSFLWRLMCTKGTVPHISSYHPTRTTNAGSIISKNNNRPGRDSTVQVSRLRSSLLRDRHQTKVSRTQVTPSSHACQPVAESLRRTEDILEQNFPFFHTTRHLLVFRGLMTFFRSLESDCIAPACKPPSCDLPFR